jgi:DNA mismatch repair protein MutL
MKIKTLSPEVIRMIAAGEVIIDAHAVIKELLENSIDSGAKNIEVHIRDAGRTIIKVKDDGEGMNKEELQICTYAHTTSKLNNINSITTLGFRGEALYSIKTVAHLEILSRCKDNWHAWKWENDQVREEPGNIGTTVTVKNLFYNYPARLKFLGSNNKGVEKIRDLIKTFSLGYPHINFIFTNNSSVNNFRNFTKEKIFSSSKYIEIDLEIQNFKVSGYVFPDSVGQYFYFVNNRPVQDLKMKKTISSVYQIWSAQRDCPSFLIFVSCSPDKIDVNIHPSKREVRLDYENFYEDLKNSLKKHATKKTSQKSEIEDWKYVGQIFQRYLIGSIDSQMIIIDQHAAHERIVFDKVKKQDFPKQRLVVPYEIEYNSEMNLENLSYISDYEKKEDQIVINSIVDFIDIRQLEQQLQKGDCALSNYLHDYGCKNSMRSGENLGEKDFEAIIQSLFYCESAAFCTHGRPTFIKISKKELDHKFKRT